MDGCTDRPTWRLTDAREIAAGFNVAVRRGGHVMRNHNGAMAKAKP